MVDDRIAERRASVRDDRRRRRLRRTILIVVLLALALLVALIDRSDLVALAEVRVEGIDRLSASDVRAAADLELGTSTLRLRLGSAEERVEALALVADATVRRADPLTVVIEVEERTPVVVAEGPRGAMLVDGDGIVIAEGAEDGLPVIEVRGPLPAVGRGVDVSPSLANAHAALLGLPGPLRSLVDRYVAVSADDLELHLASGVVVRFGRADRIDEKARSLGAVLEDIGATSVATIDVRVPSRPVVVP